MIERLLKIPCTLMASTAPADDYDQTPGEPVETGTLCYLEQTDAAEDAAGAVQWSRWQVWLPAELEPSGSDQLRIDGVVYAFEGDPAPAILARNGERSHWTGTLRRAER